MTPERLAEIKDEALRLVYRPESFEELIAEVERLTAVLAQAVQYLQGEQLPEAMKRCVEEAVNRRLVAAVAEQDRLRAVLELIRDNASGKEIVRVATEALKGS